MFKILGREVLQIIKLENTQHCMSISFLEDITIKRFNISTYYIQICPSKSINFFIVNSTIDTQTHVSLHDRKLILVCLSFLMLEILGLNFFHFVLWFLWFPLSFCKWRSTFMSIQRNLAYKGTMINKITCIIFCLYLLIWTINKLSWSLKTFFLP